MTSDAGHRTEPEGGLRRLDAPRTVMVVGSLAAALAVFYLLTTLSGGDSRDGGGGEPALHSQGIDLPSNPVSPDAPESWVQARSDASGNAAWGEAVQGPFTELWTLESSGGREFFSSPAVLDGVLYLGCNDGRMRAVDADDGRVLWSFQTACGICGEPAVDSAAVYFGGQDGTVYALDRATGARLWSSGLGYHIFCDAAILCDTLILSGNSMGKICALDASDGEPVWSAELGGLVLGPVVLDSSCVFATENGKIAAYSASGERLWLRTFEGQASPPASDGAGVYAGFSDGTVRRLLSATGETAWESDIVRGTSRCVLSRPVLLDTLLLVGTCDGTLACLGTGGGTTLWEQSFDNWLQLPPVVAGRRVYLACDDQRFHVLDLATGEKIDSLEMGGYAGTAPVLADGIVYLGTARGLLLALRGTACPPPGSASTPGAGGPR